MAPHGGGRADTAGVVDTAGGARTRHTGKMIKDSRIELTLEALNFFMETFETKVFFQFEIIITVLASSFRFI